MIPGGPGRHDRAERPGVKETRARSDHPLLHRTRRDDRGGDYRPLLADLPRGVAALAGAAHGVLIHEHIAGYAGDTRLRVPVTVYNAVLNRHEPVLP